jgi:ubiquinone/menaquinone biosynthesis C-methylase UbiE
MQKKENKDTEKPTSWENVSHWYKGAVGETGHYYQEKVILPKLLSLLTKDTPLSLLDLACGEGILSRKLPPSLEYTGIDISPSLVKEAKKKNISPTHTFLQGDITKKLPTHKKDFSCCTILLALQNIRSPLQALKNAYFHLKIGGKIFLIMNHPCFRIPRQSSWGVDLEQKIQYRRLDRYLSSLEIPIQSHPSQGKQSETTVSFHHPLSQWISWLQEAGFVLIGLQEWCSDKRSTGKHAKMEDLARKEFPLFLCLIAQKLEGFTLSSP